MLIRKRTGQEVEFSKYKIRKAINSANEQASPINKITENELDSITNKIYSDYLNTNIIGSVEHIQDNIENELMSRGHYALAKDYITYRYQHSEDRKYNDLLSEAKSIVNANSAEVEGDNANKPYQLVQCRRDYLAGLVCKKLSDELFSEECNEAHKEGIIHIHDRDYSSLPMHNCCLIDLDDMLQNGTVIGNTFIASPKSFRTACTVASQIVCASSFSQYGGMSITLTHLAPFIDISRKNIIETYLDLKESLGKEKFDEFVERTLRKEIKDGVQTLQYQFITLSNASQSPFITVFMYLNEIDDSAIQLKKDLEILIEEVLNQRYKGVQCDDGTFVSPIFPKLIYVLSENNITKDSKYYYLTELAAKCTSKRLCPDYVSEKVMKEIRGACFTSMGERKLQLM